MTVDDIEPYFLTDDELRLSEAIVHEYANTIVGYDRTMLLSQMRRLAGVVGGRHYATGWIEGRKKMASEVGTLAEDLLDANERDRILHAAQRTINNRAGG